VTDTATPTAVALFCVPATASASVNIDAGLAGPATLTLKTAVRFYRCGDRTRDGTEECDDGNAVNGDGCDEICRVER
jgi:cysteine-rich repeat protein